MRSLWDKCDVKRCVCFLSTWVCLLLYFLLLHLRLSDNSFRNNRSIITQHDTRCEQFPASLLFVGKFASPSASSLFFVFNTIKRDYEHDRATASWATGAAQICSVALAVRSQYNILAPFISSIRALRCVFMYKYTIKIVNASRCLPRPVRFWLALTYILQFLEGNLTGFKGTLTGF